MDGMTKEEKRERRQVRHEVQAEARKLASGRMGMYATNAQLNAAGKTMADRAIAQAVRG